MVYSNLQIAIKVIGVRHETAGYLSILFERPRNFRYEAGDWMDLQFDGLDLRGGKTYSFASSPSEADVAIVLRAGISPFKTALTKARAGDKLTITQYGNDYGFRLKQNKSSVLIAGGVGIAPFRSMLKEMSDNGDANTVKLIYLSQSDDFLFREELDTWQHQLQNIIVHYVVTKDLKRKDRETILRSLIVDLEQQFYIAGPTGMVDVTNKLLEEIGVDKHRIKTDAFEGY